MARHSIKIGLEHIAWMKEKKIFLHADENVQRIKVGSYISFDDRMVIEPYCGFFDGLALFDIGSFSYARSSLPRGVVVGRYCSIARNVTVPRPNHPLNGLSTSPFMYDSGMSIFKSDRHLDADKRSKYIANIQKSMPKIGNDVWIGEGVSLLPGITVGNGAVVAANSVVTKDVNPYSIVGGNPAKLIRSRFSMEVVGKLQSIAWWQYSAFDLMSIDKTDVLASMEDINLLIRDRRIRPYCPAKLDLNELVNVGII